MGGQRIDDHSFWAGKGSNGSVFPMGAKVKEQPNVEGAGAEMDYEDTSEKIHAFQEKNVSKAKAHSQKPLYRN